MDRGPYRGAPRGSRDDRRGFGARDDRNRGGRYREGAAGGRRDRRDRDDRPRRYFDDRRAEDRGSRDRKARPFTREGSRDREEARGIRARYGRAEAKPEPARDEPPPVPADITPKDLDKEVRERLSTLPKSLANLVAVHLVAAERALAEDDPDLAYEHAKVARRFGSRVGVVREAAGIAAYRAGRYAEALNDLRAARRLMGTDDLLPLLADCERGLGRPERALEVIRSAEPERLGRAVRIELAIVESGARRDLGQKEAAVVTLQRLPELRDPEPHPWSARLAFAYADALADAGKTEAAIQWFGRAMMFDEYGETDAALRYAELTGNDVPTTEIEDIEEDYADLEAEEHDEPADRPAAAGQEAAETPGGEPHGDAASAGQGGPEDASGRGDDAAADAARPDRPADDREHTTGQSRERHEPGDATAETPVAGPGDAEPPAPSGDAAGAAPRADAAARAGGPEPDATGEAVRGPGADAPSAPAEPGAAEQAGEPGRVAETGGAADPSREVVAGNGPDASVNGTADDAAPDGAVGPAAVSPPEVAGDEAAAAPAPARDET
jgi:tetratricopeptide (TPR) repeat protein